MIPLLLMLGSMTGCAVHYTVLPSDRAVLRMKANQSFSPQHDGWYVPDATWKDMNEAIADKLPPE